MASDQITGITERVIYGAIIATTAKLVEKGYLTSDMQVYIAGGGVAAIGSVWAWWNNRPARLMDRAAAQLPDNSKLVITTPVAAPAHEKDAADELANSAGATVISKVAV